MRFLFFGVGAIGTYIGGSLVLAGNDVVFLERPDVADLVKQRGLKLNLQGVEHAIKNPNVVTDIETALQSGAFDVAVQAVKSYDTDGLLKTLVPHQAILPPVLCLQNGVDNEAKIAATLGKDKVIAGTVTTAIGRRDVGDIILEKLRGMGIADESGKYKNLLSTLQSANLKAYSYEHAASMKWSKMVTNLIANATSAILQMTPGEIFNHPGLYEIEIQMLRETLQVMKKSGIPVSNLPGTPVVPLAMVVKNLPLWLSRPLLTQQVGAGRGAKMPSFYIDLYSGRGKSEVEYLNGAVVRYGAMLGVDTPVNQFLNQTLMALTRGDIALDTFAGQPEKFLKEINQ
ncbi:MAG: 2-dehydropantoate 2-reductase [Anaerolineae bacterium]|nr:2-dehydropantoate 2-reductase [Anaerolineae bacterium]